MVEIAEDILFTKFVSICIPPWLTGVDFPVHDIDIVSYKYNRHPFLLSLYILSLKCKCILLFLEYKNFLIMMCVFDTIVLHLK